MRIAFRVFSFCQQVGSIGRSPPIKEDGSCSSPDDEGPGADAELLVASGSAQQSSFFLKLGRLIHKICSTHQFRNEQVGKQSRLYCITLFRLACGRLLCAHTKPTSLQSNNRDITSRDIIGWMPSWTLRYEAYNPQNLIMQRASTFESPMNIYSIFESKQFLLLSC